MLKVKIVKPAHKAVARKLLCKQARWQATTQYLQHDSRQTQTHNNIRAPECDFSIRSVLGLYKVTSCQSTKNDRPHLSSERAKKTKNEDNSVEEDENQSRSPDGGLILEQTGELTAVRKIILTLTLVASLCLSDYLDIMGPSHYIPPGDGYRIQSPKRVLNKRQDNG